MQEKRFHLTMTVIAVVGVALSLYGMHATRLSFAPAQAILWAGLLAFLLAGAAFYRWRRLPRAVNLIMMTFWSVLVTNFLLLPFQYIAARQQVEPSDALLARADALLGINVRDLLELLGRVPAVAALLGAAYATLQFMIVLSIMVPPLCNRMDKAKEFVLGCLAAAVIALPLFAVFQARGPWDYYGYEPSPPQLQALRVFQELKGEGWYVLDLADYNGLICFPSFHTILAVLAATTLWGIPYLRWPAAVLAALIVLSTVTTGWHYLIDVLGGLAVAVAAVAVARGYLWMEARIGRPGAVPAGQ